MQKRKLTRILTLVLVLMLMIGTVSPLYAERLSNQSTASGVVKVAEGVTVIGSNAFKNNTKITEVILPSSIKEIEEGAFYGTTNLKKINFPVGLESIGLKAFEKSGLEGKIVIPGTVHTIDNLAFAGTYDLKVVVMNEGLKRLGGYVFTEQTEIHIPTTVQDTEAFYNIMYGGIMRDASNFKIVIREDALLYRFATKGYKNVEITTKYNTDAGSELEKEKEEEVKDEQALLDEKKAEILKAPDKVTANPTNQAITVDGMPTVFRAYNISGNNYFMLRDIAHIFNHTKAQFEVGWDGEKSAISLTTGKIYSGKGVGFELKTPHVKETGIKTTSVIYKNAKETVLLGYNINGNNYFKLRDLGEELNFGVEWDAENSTVVMKSVIGEEKPPVVVKPEPKPEPEPEPEKPKTLNGYVIYDEWEAVDKSNIRPINSQELEVYRQEVLERVNEYRTAEGLVPLVFDAKLNQASQYKAEDMKRTQILSHYGDYGDVHDLMSMFGVTTRYVGENASMHTISGTHAVDAWMRSPGHKANIMDPKYRKLGFGAAPSRIALTGDPLLYKPLGNPIIRIAEDGSEYYYDTYVYWCALNFSN